MSTSQLDNNLLSGQLEHVATIAKRRTGKRPSPASVWRWTRKGLRGGSIKLPAIFHGGCWQTTEAAFDAFLYAQTQAALGKEPTRDVTDTQLQAAGLLDNSEGQR